MSQKRYGYYYELAGGLKAGCDVVTAVGLLDQ